MNNDFTKCFSCNNRNSYGYCNLTACSYFPIQSTNSSEITQVSLIIPCPVSNEIKQKTLEIENDK